MKWLDNTIFNTVRLNKTAGLFGVEIEIEGDVGLPRGDAIGEWRIERDGSLKGAGDNFEYVLKVPKDLAETEAAVTNLYDNIKKSGSKVNYSMRAGIHVHVNVQQMTVRQMFTFMTLYYALEDIILTQFGEDRVGNLFCLSMTRAESVNDYIQMALEKESFDPLYHNNGYKYSAMNLECICRYGSLEFRAMQTPTTAEPVIAWLNQLYKLLEFSKGFKDPVSVLSYFSANDLDTVIKEIDPNLWKVAKELDYQSMIYNSIRNVQFWVYSTNWEK